MLKVHTFSAHYLYSCLENLIIFIKANKICGLNHNKDRKFWLQQPFGLTRVAL